MNISGLDLLTYVREVFSNFNNIHFSLIEEILDESIEVFTHENREKINELHAQKSLISGCYIEEFDCRIGYMCDFI